MILNQADLDKNKKNICYFAIGCFFYYKFIFMTENQWSLLTEVIEGKQVSPLPVGFIIDSPWLPNWYGISMLDYFTCNDLWYDANKQAIDIFPEIIFLPGFWSEFGMCSEPSAFGSVCSFPKNEFPHAKRVIQSVDDIKKLHKPDAGKDGLAPLMLNRLLINRGRIEEAGHRIYFSVSRGPLNIASFLMGTTEFLTAMMTHPDEVHELLGKITDYLCDWHELQRSEIDSIDGIFVLDDLLGFVGENEFREFALPCFKRIYDSDVKIKFLHNDADWRSSVRYLPELGVNLFNMGFDSSLNDLKKITGQKVTMLGNVPPRDCLANGTRKDIEDTVRELILKLEDRTGVVLSCGGGMPPNVSTENIRYFYNTVIAHS